MKKFAFKLALLCGIVASINCPSWAGKHNPEPLVDITSKVVSRNLLKPNKPEEELEEIYSYMTTQLPSAVHLPLLKMFSFKIFLGLYDKANREIERKSKTEEKCIAEEELIDSLRKFSENIKATINTPPPKNDQKLMVHCTRGGYTLEPYPVIMESFQALAQGPFSNISLEEEHVLDSLDHTQLQALIESPIIKTLNITAIKKSKKGIKDLFVVSDRDPQKLIFPALTCLNFTAYARYIDREHPIDDEDLFSLLHSPVLENLERLDLEYNSISNTGISAMSWCNKMGKVKHLNLARNIYNDDGVISMLRSQAFKHLISLDLSGKYDIMPRLGDRTAEALSQYPHFQKLKRLDLHSHAITDIGIRMIALSPSFPELTYLDVSNNSFTNEGALNFSTTSVGVVKPLPKLRKLTLASVEALDLAKSSFLEETIEEIIRGRPDLKVLQDY